MCQSFHSRVPFTGLLIVVVTSPTGTQHQRDDWLNGGAPVSLLSRGSAVPPENLQFSYALTGLDPYCLSIQMWSPDHQVTQLAEQHAQSGVIPLQSRGSPVGLFLYT
jgi:hypothetical protein